MNLFTKWFLQILFKKSRKYLHAYVVFNFLRSFAWSVSWWPSNEAVTLRRLELLWWCYREKWSISVCHDVVSVKRSAHASCVADEIGEWSQLLPGSSLQLRTNNIQTLSEAAPTESLINVSGCCEPRLRSDDLCEIF